MWKCVKTNNVKYDNKTLDCGISQWKSWSLDHYRQKDQTKLFRLLWPCLRRLFCSSLFLGFFHYKIYSGEINFQNISTWAKTLIIEKASKGFIVLEFCFGWMRIGPCFFFWFFDLFPRIIISGGGTDGVYAFGQP